MKVVHVINGLSKIGGAERMLSRLIQASPQVEHHLVALMNVSEAFRPTLQQCKTVTVLNWHLPNTIKVVYQLRRTIKNINPDVVHSWLYHSHVLTTLSLLGFKNAPGLIWGIRHSLNALEEESLSTKIAIYLCHFLSRQPNMLLFCAQSSLQQHQAFGFKNEKNRVITNGITLDRYEEKKTDGHSLVVGFSGRYHKAKGFNYLFEAIALVQQHNKNIVFKIAGRNVSEQNNELMSLMRHYRVDPKNVLLLGELSDMRAFYEGIDLLMLTSVTEGFPNVLLEAMSLGVPCVATNVGDVVPIVQESGFIVEPRNAQALAQAVLMYKEMSDKEKQELSAKARKIIVNQYQLVTVVKKYIDTWNEIKSYGNLSPENSPKILK